MAYLLVEDFRLGMDRRRERVAGQPGALWVGKNIHITRGGDIERRKKFIAEYDVPGTFGAAAVRAQPYVFGSDDLSASMPVGIQYQRLTAPSSPAMVAVLAAKTIFGKFYVIAEYADGSVYHFYDGARVTQWDTLAAANASFSTVASVLADKIAASSDVLASAFGSKITITAKEAGTAFTISKSTTDGGANPDQDILLTTVQANVVDVDEVRASVGITVDSGTHNPGVNYVSSVLINTVELLTNHVNWTGSNETTAISVASQINFGQGTHGYTAEAIGATVTVRAASGTGATPNGYDVVVLTHGDVGITNASSLAGGVTAVEAKKQVVTASFTGTFQAADTFQITVNGTDYLTTGLASGTGRTAYISDKRVWSPVGSVWNYCKLNTPATWTGDVDTGSLNVASESDGNEDIKAAARYQGLSAVFSPDNIILYQLDTDPANFARTDVLEKTGTASPDSVLRYGNNDVFYLDITGIRSVRARDASNAPFVSDVGNAIDAFVTEQVASMTREQVIKAVAAIEPLDGRYMLFAGEIAFVLSFFPGTKISAWSYYDLEEFDGDRVQSAMRINGRLVVRAGDSLWYYGGVDGDTYPDDDEIEGRAELPFLSGSTPATIKAFKGADMAAVNTWEVVIAADPNNANRTHNVGRFDRVSMADPNQVAFGGRSSMMAPILVCTKAGPASVSMVAIHYEAEDAK